MTLLTADRRIEEAFFTAFLETGLFLSAVVPVILLRTTCSFEMHIVPIEETLYSGQLLPDREADIALAVMSLSRRASLPLPDDIEDLRIERISDWFPLVRLAEDCKAPAIRVHCENFCYDKSRYVMLYN
jgi:hypothetical protein